MYHALIWLLIVEVLGLVLLPLAFILFRRLPDRGLALSKVLALLLFSYVLWLLASTHLLPNTLYTIIAILAVAALVSSLVLWRKLPEIASFLRREWPALLISEIVFLGLYFLWLSMTSFTPAINHTEQPMDFAFLNSILRSAYFPPEDPWLAGHSISYYYFGHLTMAFLTKLTAIPSNISYNLSMALIPALVGAGAFSLVYNLIRLSGARMKSAVVFALSAPLFLVLIGNLEGVLELVHARGLGSEGFWESVSIKGLEGVDGGAVAGVLPTDYLWWWRATRVIDTVVDGASLDYTITEFPFFSFYLGDLHAHVSSLPFLVFVLALGLNLFVCKERLGLRWLFRHPWEVFVITLALGSLAFINAWDFPVFAVLLAVLVLVKSYGDFEGRVRDVLLSSLALLAPVLVGAVALYIPFYSNFGSQASGIRALGEVSTRPLFFFLIWGPLLLLSGSFLLRQLWTVPGLRERNPGPLSIVLVITVLPFLLWAGWELLALWTGWESLIGLFDSNTVKDASTVGTRFAKLLPGMAIVGVASYTMLLRVKHGEERATAFTLLPLALALYLLVGAELFYLLDLFGNRMNTVFKVYYQAWLLLAIVSAYGLYYCCSRPMPSLEIGAIGTAGTTDPLESLGGPVRRPLAAFGRTLGYGWLGLVAVLLLASVYYPVAAALDKTQAPGDSTLDGLAFLRSSGDSGEYEAILWLRDEAPWGRIVEAVGDDYSEHGRISASTGLPTILGWKGHEHQWRGSRVPFRGREEQVARIYRSDDAEEVRQLLDAHDIRYVYVGRRERTAYGPGNLGRFPSLVQPVFRRSGVVIYERVQDNQQGVVEGDEGAG